MCKSKIYQYSVTHITLRAFRKLATIQNEKGEFILGTVIIDGRLYHVIDDIIFIPDVEEEYICVK